MTRSNAVRSSAIRTNEICNSNQAHSVSWGTISHSSAKWGKHAGALIFAAVLIVCSLTVGCSSSNDKPKSVSANSPSIAVPQAPAQLAPAPAPVMQAAAKPAPKRVVPRKPATVNYTDQAYGVTFEYPRRYAIETGSAASDLLATNPLAMNFVEPGGVALVAVELPETSFANTDFSSAFFDVSVHKSLTADQCTEFAVPQPKVITPVASTESATSTSTSAPVEKPPATSTASATTPAQPEPTQSAPAQPSAGTEQASAAKSSTDSASNSKLMLGDLELRSTEAVSGEGTRQSDSKYFHAFQNGSCYEFALNVTTDASEDGIVKHVDRDKVFSRLEQILSTVKIDTAKSNSVTTSEVSTEATPAATPAQ